MGALGFLAARGVGAPIWDFLGVSMTLLAFRLLLLPLPLREVDDAKFLEGVVVFTTDLLERVRD